MNKYPSRPALKYYGSKWQIAPWIYSWFPSHEHRIVPFAGSLSEVLRWPRPEVETVSDIDDRVFNFFRVLRDKKEELILAIRLTPWHEAEYQLAHTQSDNPLEDARRFWSLCWMSVQGGPAPGKAGFRFMKSRSGRYATIASDGINIDHLYDVARRLKHIQFLKRDALVLMEQFIDEPNVLFYLDPPYIKKTRTANTRYKHESSTRLHKKIAKEKLDMMQAVIHSVDRKSVV